MCDRETVNVAKAQPGFSNFVVIPIYAQIVNILPIAKECVDQIKSNSKVWETYEETEKDKLVYTKKNEEHIIEEEHEDSDEEGKLDVKTKE